MNFLLHVMDVCEVQEIISGIFFSLVGTLVSTKIHRPEIV